MVDMADMKTEGHGETVRFDHSRDHLLHACRISVGGIVGELPDHKTGKRAERPAQTESVEYAFDFINRFGNVLDEKYAPRTNHIEWGRNQSCYNGKITPHQQPLGLAWTVKRMSLRLDVGSRTFEFAE